MNNTEDKDETSKRPEDSAFKQQRLKAWQPLLTPRWVIGTFLGIGILFVIIGGIILDYSKKIVEVDYRYDEECAESLCNINVTIPATMKPPIFFYYKLTNFYQNHRRYVKSRDDSQLSGQSAGSDSCDPITSTQMTSTTPKLYYYPCGLIANSFFNDTFNVCWTSVLTSNTTCLSAATNTWIKNGIAWASDLKTKFIQTTAFERQQTNKSMSGFPLPEVSDEDFIVWMRTAGLPTFKKLYRKIENVTQFSAGDVLSITIQNNFPVAGFQGTKSIVLSTTSWLGGKNDFLAYAYLTVGSVCLALAIAFWIKHAMNPRNLGEAHKPYSSN